jgi:5-formyltetrahydrofolate cyclo-ligase
MKGSLRKELRARRRALTPEEHALRSRLAASAITRLPAFRAGARVAIYLPFDGEVNTAALLIAAERRGVHVYVPVVSDVSHRRMRFYPVTGRTRRGTFGISVPHATPGRPHRLLPPRWFDLVVVPLVGIDRHGRRLGMGLGFYDRAFGFRRQRRHWRGPLLVGLGFECQRVQSVHPKPWDLALDALATERGVEHFTRGIEPFARGIEPLRSHLE